MSKLLREELQRHVLLARAMTEQAEVSGWDPVVERDVNWHISQAEAIRAQLDAEDHAPAEVSAAGSRGIADLGRRGGDWRFRSDAEKYDTPIPAGKSLREHLGHDKVDEEALLGWLGHYVKSQVWPSDYDQQQRWNRAIGVKDMVTTSTGAGGALVPTVLATYLIDLMRNSVVCLAAGARTVPMSSKVVQIPRLTADVSAAWLDEAASVTPSDATLDQVTLTARRMEVGPVKISHELNEDSDPVTIGQVVSRSIAAAAALKLDAAALRGSGTPPEPKGIRYQTGVTLYAPGGNGDPLTWDLLLAASRSVFQANAIPTALIMTPNASVTLGALRAVTDGQYLSPPPPFGDLRRLTTNAIPSNLTKGSGSALTEVYLGDFAQLLIGMRTALSVQTLNELYRATGEIGVIARMRADVAVEHGPAFAVCTFVDD